MTTAYHPYRDVTYEPDPLEQQPCTHTFWHTQLGRRGPTAQQAQNPTSSRIHELRTMPYWLYLLSPEWAETRRRALGEAAHTCRRCRRNIDDAILDVHHRTYDRIGHEHPDDLEVLCRPCHHQEHAISV